METAAVLRRRIELAEELRSITGTMKSMSAVTGRQYERSVHALHEYVRTLELGLGLVLRAHPEVLIARGGDAGVLQGGTLVVVFGSARGLCGPINRHVAAAAVSTRDEAAGESPPGAAPTVVSVGARLAVELEAAGVRPGTVVAAAGSAEGIGAHVADLLVRIDEWRSGRSAGRVLLVHPRPGVGTWQYDVVVVPLLPVDAARLRRLAAQPWPTRVLPEWHGSWTRVFTALRRQLLFVDLHRAFAETQVCVHRARLAAMQGAEESIGERLEELRLRYNHQRQAAITGELLDIVSGYEAAGGAAGSRP